MNEQQIELNVRCPIRTTLELLGGKWKLLILYQLIDRPLRLSELRKKIPNISEKMLIQELKVLMDSRLVKRTNFGEVPPRVIYELNPVGLKIIPLINELKNFAMEYENTINTPIIEC